jgi:hypothetical protein
MKNFLLIFLIIFIAVISLFMFEANWRQKKLGKVCLSDYCFNVQLAITAGEKEKGLMDRNKLADDEGMLFVYDSEGGYGYWMKNTFIPLDIIWIDKDKNVVYVNENTQPCIQNDCPIIKPNVKAKYILEVNAGTSKKIGIKEGSGLEIVF